MADKLQPLKKGFEHMELRSFKKPQIDITNEILKQKEYEQFLALEKQNKGNQKQTKTEHNEGELDNA